MDNQEVLKTQAENDGMDAGQKVMIGLVALVVLVGGYFVFKPNAGVSEKQADSLATSLASTSAVIDGAHTYTFDGLMWVFEPQPTDENGAPITRVRLKIEGFTRNGVPIDVALYRLGTYRGDCRSYEDMPEGYALPIPGSLAFTQCWFAGGGRQLAVFQEGGALVVKVRTVSEEEAQPEPLTTILTIDLTKIVQSVL